MGAPEGSAPASGRGSVVRLTICSLLFLLCLLLGCGGSEQRFDPAGIGAVRVTETDAFPPEHEAAASAVVAELARDGETPSEFFAVVTETGKQLEFALWHSSAFLPENRGQVGNPGGRCRTYNYEIGSATVVKKSLWQ